MRLFFTLCLMAIASDYAMGQDCNSIYKEASGLYDDNKYKETISLVNASIKDCQKSGDIYPNLLRLLGASHYYLQAPKEAEKYLTVSKEAFEKNKLVSREYARTLNTLGNVQRDQKNYQASEQSYLRSRSIYAELKDTSKYAIYPAENLTKLYHDQKKDNLSEKSWREVIAWYELRKPSTEFAGSLNSFGNFLSDNGAWSESLQTYQRCLKEYRKLNIEDKRTAHPYYNIGLLYKKLNKPDSAIANLLKGADLYHKADESANELDALQTCALVYARQDKIEKVNGLVDRIQNLTTIDPQIKATRFKVIARELCSFKRIQEGNVIAEKGQTFYRGSLNGTLTKAFADYLNGLAIYYDEEAENSPMAEKYYRESLEIQTKINPSGSGVANASYNLADLLLTQEKHAEAEKYYLSALSIYKKTNNNDFYGDTRGRLIATYALWKRPDKYEKAIDDLVRDENYREYIFQATAVFSDDENLETDERFGTLLKSFIANFEKNKISDGNYAGILDAMASYQSRQDEEAEAIKYYKQAVAAYEAAQIMDSDYASSLYNLGDSYNNLGQYVKAEPYFIKSAEIYLKDEGKSDSYADAIGYLGDLYESMGQYHKAEEYLLKAVSLYDSLKGKYNKDYTQVLYQLGILYQNMGNYSKSEVFFLENAKIDLRITGSESYARATDLKALGGLYEAKSNYDRADKYYDSAKAVYLKLHDQSELADILDSKASLAINLGQYTIAEDMINQALAIYKSKNLKPDETYNDILATQANLYQNMGKYALAENLKKKLLAEVREKEGTGKLYATKLESLGSLYYTKGDYLQAEKQYVRCKQIRDSLGITGIALGDSYANLGNIRRIMGDLTSAEEYYLKSRDIYLERAGEGMAYALSLGRLAGLYRARGQYGLAEQNLNKALSIKEKLVTTNSPSYASTLSSQGWLHMELSQFDLAQQKLEQSSSIIKSIYSPNSNDYATSLRDLGVLASSRGKYPEAEKYFDQAMTLYAKNPELKFTDSYANIINDLAILNKVIGEYDKAEKLYNQSLDLYRKLSGDQSTDVAMMYNNLGILYYQKGDYSRAEQNFIKALEMRKVIFGKESPAYAGTLGGFGDLDRARGRYKSAEEKYNEELSIILKTRGKESVQYADVLSDLAMIARVKKSYISSEKLFKEAEQIYEVRLSKAHPLVGVVHQNFGNLYWNQRLYPKATLEMKAMVENYFGQIDAMFQVMSDHEREAFYKILKKDLEMFTSFACVRAGSDQFMGSKDKAPDPTLLGDLYNVQLSTKALLLSSASKLTKGILRSGNDSIKQQFRKWQQDKIELANLKRNKDVTSQAVIDSLDASLERREKEFLNTSTTFTGSFNDARFTWKNVKEKLKPGEAAIEVIRFSKYGAKDQVPDSSAAGYPRYVRMGLTDTIRYAVLIVTTETPQPQLVMIPNGNDLEGKYLNSYRDAIFKKQIDLESYNAFWKSIIESPWIKGKATKLYFSPDGVYNQISINTLLNPVSKKYVIDENLLELVTNTRDIILPPAEEEGSTYGLLIGNPTYYLPNNAKTSKVVLSNLPGAEEEVKQIQGMLNDNRWRKVDVLLEDKASEERLKKMDYKPKILHIATHGFFNQSIGKVAGTRGGEADGPDQSVKANLPIINPMLSSGLVLKGGGDALNMTSGTDYDLLDRNDGLLTAYEAMNLNLQNTDLVVLSACETGLGEVSSGEGVYGLQRALKVAGAQAIIMSLWSVSDESTMVLMKEFYSKWLASIRNDLPSGEKLGSFRDAQLAVRKNEKFSHPFFWGAFVMIGD